MYELKLCIFLSKIMVIMLCLKGIYSFKQKIALWSARFDDDAFDQSFFSWF